MKPILVRLSIVHCGLLAAFLMIFARSAPAADAIPGKAMVRGVQGLVSYSDEDGLGMPLKAGTILHPGAVIQTESSGLAEIAFDGGVGVLRLTGNTTIVIEKMAVQRSREGDIVELQLTLRIGAVIGRTEKLRPGSNFEIKTLSGLAGVRRGLYRIDAMGKVEVADGQVAFVAARSGSAPVMNTLEAPPAKIYAPGEGIKAAPANLATELEAQLAARFKKR